MASIQISLLNTLNNKIKIDNRSERLLLKSSAHVVSSQLDLFRFIKDYLPSTSEALKEAQAARDLLKEAHKIIENQSEIESISKVLVILDQLIIQIKKVQVSFRNKNRSEATRQTFLTNKISHDIAQRIEQLGYVRLVPGARPTPRPAA